MINKILYPNKLSEFEVQARLYNRLRACWLDVRGCVPAVCSDGDKCPRVFFDLVIFRNKVPVVIIECKNHQRTRKSRMGSRQSRRYGKFNLPILVCVNEAQSDSVFHQVLEMVRHCKS